MSIKMSMNQTHRKKFKNLWFRNANIQSILIFLLLPLIGCEKKSENHRLDAAFLWGADQKLIVPSSGNKHIWSGFHIEHHSFVSFKKRAKLILWRNCSDSQIVSIRYVIKGDPVILVINEKRSWKLISSKNQQPVTLSVFFKKGFNLLEFKKKEDTRFRIESITLGSADIQKSHDLKKGESVSAALSPGIGFVSCRGKGLLEISMVRFINGVKFSEKKVLRTRKLRFPLSFKSPGFIRISCISGYVDIIDYIYANESQFEDPVVRKVPGNPDIYIFLIDGCQQSHLGIYGYHRQTSPFLDELAKDSVVFDNAYANATFTSSSVASIFTGMLPQRHKVNILINKLSGRHFLLTEYLKKKGYRTSVFSEAGNISPRFGFGQGVDVFPRLFFRVMKNQRLIEKQFYQSFQDFTKEPGPRFTYLHFRAPHFPVIPPPPFLDMFRNAEKGFPGEKRLIFKILDLVKMNYPFTESDIADITSDYDSAIRYADDRINRLTQLLKKRGLYDDSLVIFTSDHGEALYEHQQLGHGFNVFNETSQVPLIIKFPLSLNLRGRIETVVQLADIFPMVAALFGETVDVDGKSLFGAIREGKLNDNMVISTSFHNIADFGIRWRNWYYLIRLSNNSEELYNLSKDPRMEVSRDNPEVLFFFRGRFISWLKESDQRDETGEILNLKKLPEDIRDNLRTFGYIE